MIKLLGFSCLAVIAVLVFLWQYRKNLQKTGLGCPHKRRGHKHAEAFSVDLYAYASRIRGWNADFKISFASIMMILTLALNHPYVSLTVIFAMMYITVIKGGMDLGEYFLILSIPLAFFLTGALAIIIDFSRQAKGIWHWNLGFVYLISSPKQLKEGIFLILKAFASLSALQMMTLSTPMGEIIAFLRKIFIPRLFIELMYLIYRFIFLLLDGYRQMKNAASARSGYLDFKSSCRTFGNIVANLLLISLKRANGYYDAMQARGYEGELLFLQEEKELKKKHILFSVVFIAFLFFLWKFM